ncbi:MAG: YbaN family protein [Dehalococcoidia bacterium]
MTELVDSGVHAADLRPSDSRLARAFYLGAGTLSVAVGVLGIFLPLLPTTIFLLIGAACYGRSSPAAYRWLTTNRVFGRYLRRYKEERGATVLTKVTSIGALWAGIGLAIWLVSLPLWAAAGLVTIAALVTWHLLSLRTIRA